MNISINTENQNSEPFEIRIYPDINKVYIEWVDSLTGDIIETFETDMLEVEFLAKSLIQFVRLTEKSIRDLEG